MIRGRDQSGTARGTPEEVEYFCRISIARDGGGMLAIGTSRGFVGNRVTQSVHTVGEMFGSSVSIPSTALYSRRASNWRQRGGVAGCGRRWTRCAAVACRVVYKIDRDSSCRLVGLSLILAGLRSVKSLSLVPWYFLPVVFERMRCPSSWLSKTGPGTNVPPNGSVAVLC